MTDSGANSRHACVLPSCPRETKKYKTWKNLFFLASQTHHPSRAHHTRNTQRRLARPAEHPINKPRHIHTAGLKARAPASPSHSLTLSLSRRYQHWRSMLENAATSRCQTAAAAARSLRTQPQTLSTSSLLSPSRSRVDPNSAAHSQRYCSRSPSSSRPRRHAYGQRPPQTKAARPPRARRGTCKQTASTAAARDRRARSRRPVSGGASGCRRRPCGRRASGCVGRNVRRVKNQNSVK
jgi:hypothetical protein